jgi:hypothetical protein
MTTILHRLIQSIREAAVYNPKKPGQVKIKTGFRYLKNPKKIAT